MEFPMLMYSGVRHRFSIEVKEVNIANVG